MTGAEVRKRRIAAVFEGYRATVIPADAGPVQVRECRMAFFAGATALFTMLTMGVGDDDEPSEAEMAMMDEIGAELREFGQQFDAEHLPTEGSA